MASINPVVQFYPYIVKAGVRPRLPLLPIDAVNIIFGYLTPDDLINCRPLNKRLSFIADHILQSRIHDFIKGTILKIQKLNPNEYGILEVLGKLELREKNCIRDVKVSWDQYYKTLQKEIMSLFFSRFHCYSLCELRQMGLQEQNAFPRRMVINIPLIIQAENMAMRYLAGRVFDSSRKSTLGLIPVCAALLSPYKRFIDEETNGDMVVKLLSHIRDEPLSLFDSTSTDHEAGGRDLVKKLLQKNLFLTVFTKLINNRKTLNPSNYLNAPTPPMCIHIISLLQTIGKFDKYFSSLNEEEIQNLGKILNQIKALVNDPEQHASLLLFEIYRDLFSVQLKMMQRTPLLK